MSLEYEPASEPATQRSGSRRLAGSRSRCFTPTPYTLHPAPCTLHPSPYTLHPKPQTESNSNLNQFKTWWQVGAEGLAEKTTYLFSFWLRNSPANQVRGITEMCSGSEAGSYLRLIDFVYHSTLPRDAGGRHRGHHGNRGAGNPYPPNPTPSTP